MAVISFKGSAVSTSGELPRAGEVAPPFVLTRSDLTDISSEHFAGRKLVLNIFPSIDTPVCAASVRRFNREASSLPGTTVVCVSADLPFAHKRFCAAEGIDNVQTLSSFRSPAFGTDYGVLITDGALRGLLARAVVVIAPDRTVLYSQLVPEIGNEPDYDAALKVAREA